MIKNCFMYFVYVIRSVNDQVHTYIGYTNNLDRRISEHNSEDNISYTARHRPWEIVSYFAFTSEYKALDFEKFLKSGSGNVFVKRRLL